jgi:hypothetical protein
MIITEKQLLCLIDVSKDSLRVNVEVPGQFLLRFEQRRDLYEEILNQQSAQINNFKE